MNTHPAGVAALLHMRHARRWRNADRSRVGVCGPVRSSGENSGPDYDSNQNQNTTMTHEKRYPEDSIDIEIPDDMDIEPNEVLVPDFQMEGFKDIRAEYAPDVFPQYGGVVGFYRVDSEGNEDLDTTIPLDLLKQVMDEWEGKLDTSD